MKLAITICATKSYAYAMKSQARLLAANLQDVEGGHIILSTDGSPELEAIEKYYAMIFPEGWQIHNLADKALGEHENYKPSAQQVIAQLRTMAFTFARKLRVDLCWSLDSDVLPPANAFRCLKNMLEFDDGYYAISTCSYPNEGFLGGRGTPHNPIAEDFLPEERDLPEPLKRGLSRLEEKQKLAATLEEKQRLDQVGHRLMQRVKKHPPKGNIFELNAKRWRPRGWLENAYPAIGKGAVVPSDWCGFGCTLLNREALAHANFEGYDGQGTEDLWVIWKRWHQVGLRINVITHVVCDHVIHEKKKGGDEGQYTHIRAYHETEGETVGHIRTEKRPWLYD